MPLGKPPPNPLRHVSQLIALGHLSKSSPSPNATPNRERADSFVDDEAPTAKKGVEIQAYLLVRYFKDCSPEDQAYLIRLAEGYAARNAKT
jgi:hypothetical protein